MEQSRECGECDLCCKWLSHDVYGQLISPTNPCRFLKNGCSIYENRPPQCKRYSCMWLQGVLPEWMYPKDTGVIVSVKNWPHGQWLEVLGCDTEIPDEFMKELLKFKAPIKYTKDGEIFIIGPPEFEEYYKYYVSKNRNLLPHISD